MYELFDETELSLDSYLLDRLSKCAPSPPDLQDHQVLVQFQPSDAHEDKADADDAGFFDPGVKMVAHQGAEEPGLTGCYGELMRGDSGATSAVVQTPAAAAAAAASSAVQLAAGGIGDVVAEVPAQAGTAAGRVYLPGGDNYDFRGQPGSGAGPSPYFGDISDTTGSRELQPGRVLDSDQVGESAATVPVPVPSPMPVAAATPSSSSSSQQQQQQQHASSTSHSHHHRHHHHHRPPMTIDPGDRRGSASSSTASSSTTTSTSQPRRHARHRAHHSHHRNHRTRDPGGSNRVPGQTAEQNEGCPSSSESADRHCHHHHHHHHYYHRKNWQAQQQQLHQEAASQETTDEDTHHQSKRKKSTQSLDGSETMDEQGDDEKSCRSSEENKKHNHSEIEKRRRDKMNTYIGQLSTMIPMCHAMSRKLDKLTVLRMALQHIRTLKGSARSAYGDGHTKPAILDDEELKTLILQAAEGFVFSVGCGRGKILYVSKSVTQALNYSQAELLGQSWFDIIHPKDVAKVKEQLSSSEFGPRERLIDAKTMLPVKPDVSALGVSKLCPGSRRSFFCRMKRKMLEGEVRCTSSNANSSETHHHHHHHHHHHQQQQQQQVKEEADTTTGYCHQSSKKKQHQQHQQQQQSQGNAKDWKYCVVQCTGYLKSWPNSKLSPDVELDLESDGESCNLSCLVAVGRILSTSAAVAAQQSPNPSKIKLRNLEFISRHAFDGKFLYVDQRTTVILGFLPHELTGTSFYEYCAREDLPHLMHSYKAALQSSERITTRVYRFRTKRGGYIKLRSEWRAFTNPWTKEIEYLIAKNTVISPDNWQVESSATKTESPSAQENYEYLTQCKGGLERLISSHMEVSKIGRQIAEEVLDAQRRSGAEGSSAGSSPSFGTDILQNTESQISTTASPEGTSSSIVGTTSQQLSNSSTSSFDQVNNGCQMQMITSNQGTSGDEDMMELINGNAINESPSQLSNDAHNGNDEAAMAVIMSLLEADAGLGGPVDFSGLPWPLP